MHLSNKSLKFVTGLILALLYAIGLSGCSYFGQKIETPLPADTLSQTEREDLKKPAHLQDLAYGEILYDYYRGEEISALTKILIAQKENQLPNHANSAELLSGVIYLNLGMLVKAQAIFKRLLTEQDLKHELIAKIEFYLAKLHYKQNDYPQAKERLTRVYQSLSVDLQDECFIMLGNIALSNKQLAEARDWLNLVSHDSELLIYSRFNLGIIWLKDGQLEQALPFLTKIFSTPEPTDLQRSLQDKAKIALGFYYLKRKQLEEARAQFLSVRLESPYTNKALLGMGWTYVEKGDYNKALSHWLELRKGDIRDIAVQEALLAIPYAYQKLNAMQPALDKYLDATELFQQQLDLIANIEKQVTDGRLVEKLVGRMIKSKQSERQDENIRDSKIFGDDYDYYIYELLAQNSFNENFRSYQKLGRLELLIDHWENQLPMLNEMLRSNQIRFDEKIPQVDAYISQNVFDKYRRDYENVQQDLGYLNRHEKLYLLADKQQTALHSRILRLENNIENIPPEMLIDNQIDKARRARGVLQWQLEQERVNKIWQIQKASQQIKGMLTEMETLTTKLTFAREHALTRFVGYQEQVDEGSIRLTNLRAGIQMQIDFQADLIKQQILAVLKQRKITLEHFLLQSDLSVARLHEQAVFIPEVD